MLILITGCLLLKPNIGECEFDTTCDYTFGPGSVCRDDGYCSDPNADNDLDGYTPTGGDCDDFDSDRYPGAVDVLNDGVDQDCTRALCGTHPPRRCSRRRRRRLGRRRARWSVGPSGRRAAKMDLRKSRSRRSSRVPTSPRCCSKARRRDRSDGCGSQALVCLLAELGAKRAFVKKCFWCGRGHDFGGLGWLLGISFTGLVQLRLFPVRAHGERTSGLGHG